MERAKEKKVRTARRLFCGFVLFLNYRRKVWGCWRQPYPSCAYGAVRADAHSAQLWAALPFTAVLSEVFSK